MNTMMPLVKDFCITTYLMYSYTSYAIPVAEKVGRFQLNTKSKKNIFIPFPQLLLYNFNNNSTVVRVGFS